MITAATVYPGNQILFIYGVYFTLGRYFAERQEEKRREAKSEFKIILWVDSLQFIRPKSVSAGWFAGQVIE
ncbi:hypothetical protein AYI80_01640 [Shewanella algae]|nr:hypothetical protein AYI80_01640 [Shewanella algae]